MPSMAVDAVDRVRPTVSLQGVERPIRVRNHPNAPGRTRQNRPVRAVGITLGGGENGFGICQKRAHNLPSRPESGEFERIIAPCG